MDLERWANDLTRSVFMPIEEEKYCHQYWSSRRLRRNSVKLNKVIKNQVLIKLKHSNLIRRIQKVWRTGNRRESPFGVIADRFQKAWRLSKLLGLGTKYTAVGLIGPQTNNSKSIDEDN